MGKQRMVGMQEMPLQVRNKWKHETKFVLKRVGQDPSWRARLGNLMSFNEDQEHSSTDRNTTSSNVPGNNSLLSSETSAVSRLPSEDQEEVEEDPGKEFPTTADHFLVCVFNVSSKVSYSILQVAKTSSVKDVIVQALAKNRKDSESDRKSPEDYVLVEEIDVLDSSRKANKSNKMKRIIDPSENVYLIQLSWKGAGRFILEDKDKLANEHGTLTETYSEPLGAKAGLSPSLRRQSRIIASGVRRLSRSFYGGSGENLGHSHRRTGSFAELSGGNGNHGSLRQLPTGQHSQATPHPLAGRDISSHHMSRKRVPLPKFGQTQSDSDLQAMEEQESDSVTLKNSSGSGINSSEVQATNSSSNSSTTLNSSNSATGQASTTSIPISKKLSRITLRKLKIW